MSHDPQGIKSGSQRYQFIPRTLIFIFHEDKVLLLKGSPHKRLWANRYNGIGGHIEQGESIPNSVLREVQEEVGLTDLSTIRLRGIITIDPNTNPGVLIVLFTAEAQTTVVQASSEGTPEWVDWRALPPETMVEDLPILLSKLTAMQDTDQPFYAHYHYDAAGALIIEFA